jgi:hypothetical protein
MEDGGPRVQSWMAVTINYEMNAYEYADSMSMYSFPSGSHTLYSIGISYSDQDIKEVTHLAPSARSKTTGRG